MFKLLFILQNKGKFLFKDEKINTVVMVVMIIFVGVAVYLLLMGRKLSKAEKELTEIRKKKEHAEKQNR